MLPAVGHRRRRLRPRRQAAAGPGRQPHRVRGEDPCSFRVTLPTGQKRRADHAVRLVPAAAWQTVSGGHGSKGERRYGWAWLATASARHHLLIRRRLTDPAGLAYFSCHVPAGRACSFTTLIRIAGRRWTVEEDSRSEFVPTLINQEDVVSATGNF